MNNQEIGGYFELELQKRNSFLDSNGVLLNSGKNALEYILIGIGSIKKVWIPIYTCDTVLDPFIKLNISYSFYHINEDLELSKEISLQVDEYIVINNYFGIKDSYVNQLIDKYGDKAIVDSTQSLFSKYEKATYVFYSLRKFVGVPDGGIAVTKDNSLSKRLKTDDSCDRCSHLLKRYDRGASDGYCDFKKNGDVVRDEDLKLMSNLTKSIMSSIDIVQVKEKRTRNFEYLHSRLYSTNKFKFKDVFTSPMVYPYYTESDTLRNLLINEKIFVATYWPNVYVWCKERDTEYKLASFLLPLPIDQRYSQTEMERIVDIIDKSI